MFEQVIKQCSRDDIATQIGNSGTFFAWCSLHFQLLFSAWSLFYNRHNPEIEKNSRNDPSSKIQYQRGITSFNRDFNYYTCVLYLNLTVLINYRPSIIILNARRIKNNTRRYVTLPHLSLLNINVNFNALVALVKHSLT